MAGFSRTSGLDSGLFLGALALVDAWRVLRDCDCDWFWLANLGRHNKLLLGSRNRGIAAVEDMMMGSAGVERLSSVAVLDFLFLTADH